MTAGSLGRVGPLFKRPGRGDPASVERVTMLVRPLLLLAFLYPTAALAEPASTFQKFLRCQNEGTVTLALDYGLLPNGWAQVKSVSRESPALVIDGTIRAVANDHAMGQRKHTVLEASPAGLSLTLEEPFALTAVEIFAQGDLVERVELRAGNRVVSKLTGCTVNNLWHLEKALAAEVGS